MSQEQKIQEALTRGVENIYPSRQALEKRLKSGQKIRLYCGFDPTAPTLHIGNAIQIRKLAQFQAMGHEVIFLIGDFTGMIGDPTDKTETRQKLTREQVLKNSQNYKKLASKILSFSGKNPAKLIYNSEWNDKVSFVELIELASNFTVQQMIVRDMFQERIKKGKPIYLHEFLYPLTQAYDSVAMDVDLEVGGNDQTFNMLCGRDLMKAVKNKEKFVLATKLLADPSCGKKMSKTEGNMITLDEKPNEMFGQIMAWSDGLIVSGFELCTDVPVDEIRQMEQDMRQDKLNPRDAKARLAREIVAIHHSQKAALEAEREFNRIFREKAKPSEMPVHKTTSKKYQILDLLVETKLAPSKSEAKRLIKQGGVKVDDQVIKDWQEEINIKNGIVIQVGKRKFIQIKV
jgi:tyrosyl-tRNA synthetase